MRDGVTKTSPAAIVQISNYLKSLRLDFGSEVFGTRLALSTMFALVWQQTEQERWAVSGPDGDPARRSSSTK